MCQSCWHVFSTDRTRFLRLWDWRPDLDGGSVVRWYHSVGSLVCSQDLPGDRHVSPGALYFKWQHQIKSESPVPKSRSPLLLASKTDLLSYPSFPFSAHCIPITLSYHLSFCYTFCFFFFFAIHLEWKLPYYFSPFWFSFSWSILHYIFLILSIIFTIKYNLTLFWTPKALGEGHC